MQSFYIEVYQMNLNKTVMVNIIFKYKSKGQK
jgi:hypothetical protein